MTPDRRSRYAASAYGSSLALSPIAFAMRDAGRLRLAWTITLAACVLVALGLAFDAGVDEP